MPEKLDVPVEQLDLDPDNPRLPEGHQAQTPDGLLEVMARDYSLSELARSFVDNRYFEEEPLAAVQRGERYLVVEGNRRVAALRLLSSPDLIDHLGLGPDWQELSREFQLHPIKTVPVVLYDTRDQIIPFLGFRHISGVRRWEPKEKARFINALLHDGSHEFAEVVRMLGSSMASVRSNYVAYRILCQARDEFGLDARRLETSFGVFLRALSSAPVKAHIGIDLTDKTPMELLNPVPPNHKEHLGEIIDWVFGVDTRNPVIGDSRQITKLGWILEEPQALEVLRTSRNFQLALALTRGEMVSLLENLRKANYHLDEVKRDLDRHRESPEVKVLVDRVMQSAQSIAKLFEAQAEGQ